MMPAFEGDEGQAHADIEGGEGGRPMTFTIQFTQFDGIISTEEGAEAGGFKEICCFLCRTFMIIPFEEQIIKILVL